MDVTTIRARNIAMLVEQRGGPTAFGKEIERDQVQVSQWTSHLKPKPIGGRLARYIEEKLGHERGWLDRPQWQADETPAQSQSHSLQLDPDTLAETARTLRERFGSAVEVYELIESQPHIFIEAYELYASSTTDERTPEVERALAMRVADLTPQGANKDERGTSMPTKGTTERKVGTGRKR
jgi:hypothetical protein